MLQRSQEVNAVSTGTRHSQNGDALRDGRHDGGARQINVVTDVGPLLQNCRSWYRLIDLQAQNIEWKGCKCKTVAQRTVHASPSSLLSASKIKGKRKNKTMHVTMQCMEEKQKQCSRV